ncbi:MAG: ketopantoate reductase family protein [Solirubrobacteraceae bacterium]
MFRIAILGPGGVGGFLAAALARAGEAVSVIAREETASVIRTDGITVRSVRLGDFVAHPAAAIPVLDEPVGLLLVATKAVGLHTALDRVAAAPALVVPLLNGLEHMMVLRERFGEERVAAGTIRVESDRPSPGHVVQTSDFLRVDLAADASAVRSQLPDLVALLERAGIPARIERSEAQALWSKLVRLCALACTTSAIDRPIGFIRSDPQWRDVLVACIEEASAAAAADGAEIDPAARLAELDGAHPELGSSMQRDVAAGREPELDAIPGAVVRAAVRHGLQCPTIAQLGARIAERAGLARPDWAR